MNDYKELVEHLRKFGLRLYGKKTSILQTAADAIERLVTDIDAVRKEQIPKKPIFEADKEHASELAYDTWYCPRCDEIFSVKYDRHKFCPECAQPIDWSEVE